MSEDSEDSATSMAEGVTPESTLEQVASTVRDATGRVVLLDDEMTGLATAGATAATDLIAEADEVSSAVILGGEHPQRVLDITAQRGTARSSPGSWVRSPGGR